MVKISWSIPLIWNELDKINWALSINNEVYNCARICRLRCIFYSCGELQLVGINDTSLNVPWLGVSCIMCEAPEKPLGNELTTADIALDHSRRKCAVIGQFRWLG